MSFETGTATSREDLLDKFRLFSLSSGYTVNRFAVSGTGYVLNMQKVGSYSDTIYPSLRSINNEDLSSGVIPPMTGIMATMADGYDSGKDAVDQTGSPRNINNPTEYYGAAIHPVGTIARYWFFSDTAPEFLAMAVQLPSGDCRHIVFGQIEKTDATVGRGDFFYASNGITIDDPINHLPFDTLAGVGTLPATSFIRLNMDERDGWWSQGRKGTLSQDLPTSGIVFGANYIDSTLRKYSKNNFSNAPCLTAFNLYALQQSGIRSLIGYIPNLRSARRDAVLLGQEYPLGPDTWIGFPSGSQTGEYALVYRKVV